MSNYKFVRTLEGFRGVAKAYRHTGGGQDIVISRVYTPDRGDETMIFPYDLKNDKVIDWGDLWAEYGVDHETTLANFEAEEGE